MIPEPIADVSRPLITPTTARSTRENASASTTTSRAVLKSGVLPPTSPALAERMSSTMYCWSFGGTSSATTPTKVSRQRNTEPRA